MCAGRSILRKIPYQQDFYICLEQQITNSFEGLVLQGGSPAWKELHTNKINSLLENTLTIQIDKGKWTLSQKWILFNLVTSIEFHLNHFCIIQGKLTSVP